MAKPADSEKLAREEFRRLWKIEDATRPGPKPAHSARSIARVGIAVADEDGLSALTMRKVASRLSVSAMSLYNQVPGKAELLEIMVDEVAGELLEPASGDWRERASAVAWANWHCFLRHAWLLSLDGYRPVLGPNILQKYELELSIFEDIGLTDIEMDFALGSLLALVKGCVVIAIDANGSLKRSNETDLDWWNVRKPLLEKLMLEDRFPLAARVGSAIGVYSEGPQAPEDTFRFGLKCWLAGMSELIASRGVEADAGRNGR